MIDKEVVLELIELSRESDPEMLDQIIGNFRRSGPQLIAEIELAYIENNSENVKKAAHKLKGGAGMLGLLDLSQRASEVMTIAQRHEIVDHHKNVSDLAKILHNNLTELSTFVEQNRS